MRSGCPLLMTGSQPAQILEPVPTSESEKDAKYAGYQPGRETENAFASDKESKAETKREWQQCAIRHPRDQLVKAPGVPANLDEVVIGFRRDQQGHRLESEGTPTRKHRRFGEPLKVDRQSTEEINLRLAVFVSCSFLSPKILTNAVSEGTCRRFPELFEYRHLIVGGEDDSCCWTRSRCSRNRPLDRK
jgi:hypothetical protein